MGCNIPPEIAEYIAIVENDIKQSSKGSTGDRELPVCKEQRQLIKLVKRVFLTDDIYVDTNQLARYMAVQEHFPFRLFAWEKFCFTLHCCTYWSGSGEPRFPSLFLFVGRGAGKNGYLSFENFCLLSAINGIRGYHIDICATSEDQAKTTPDEIREDVLEMNNSYMRQYFHWTKEVIQNRATTSRLRYRTNRSESKDGLRAGKVDFDEYHQYQDYKNVNVFIGGLGKKAHARITYATTDGSVRGGPLDDLKAQAAAVLNGQPDKGLLPFICKLDRAKEAENPQLWPKANPSLPYMPNLRTQMLNEWVQCQDNPQLYSGFMEKRMNLPQGNKDTQVTAWKNILATNQKLPNMKGWPCVAGIDFARSEDFVAVGLLFRKGNMRYWLSHTFVCRNSPDLKRIKAPLDEWEKKGLLTYIDDVEINPSIPVNWLAENAMDYYIMGVGIDLYRYSLLSSELEKNGFDVKGENKNVKLVRPSNQQFVEPVINSIFLNRYLAVGDDPLFRWYVNNTKKVTSVHGNFSYEKIEPKSRKTDGFMAFVFAMAQEELLEDNHEEQTLLEAFVF